MINIKTIKHITLIFIVFLMASCVGSTDREWAVDNSSSTAIFLRVGLLASTDTIYKIILKGEKTVITITTDDFGNADPQQAFDVFSHLLIVNADGDTSNIEWVDNDSWDIYIEQTKRRPDHFHQTYDLVVTDADFN